MSVAVTVPPNCGKKAATVCPVQSATPPLSTGQKMSMVPAGAPVAVTMGMVTLTVPKENAQQIVPATVKPAPVLVNVRQSLGTAHAPA